MVLDKILSKIQNQIKEATGTLELFVDISVQPSVDDCEKLQKQISHLQELVAVYKYKKEEKEISPSFTLHAKINEVVEEKEIGEEEASLQIHSDEVVVKSEDRKIEPDTREVTDARRDNPIVYTIPSEEMKAQNSHPLVIGINDKFRFINELFKQNASEYNIALEQLGAVRTWNEAEFSLNNLKNLYEWKEENEVVKYFYTIVKKRFS
jgi:hypothetical protein